MIRFVYFLCGLWLLSPLTVAFLTGSVFWTIASGVIGALVVFGWMALAELLDDWGPPPPLSREYQQIEAAIDGVRDLQRLLYKALDEGRGNDAARLRAELDERAEQVRAMLAKSGATS